MFAGYTVSVVSFRIFLPSESATFLFANNDFETSIDTLAITGIVAVSPLAGIKQSISIEIQSTVANAKNRQWSQG